MPPIASITSVPPDFTRPEPRVRDRQRLASDLVDQVQRRLGTRPSQAPLAAATQTPITSVQARESQPPRLQPPLDLVQRFFSERQAVLREAALQRDEILQQQANEQQLRPIAQALREADRLQVLRDAQLLETQRLASQRIAPAQDTERLLAQRETLRADERRLEEQRLSQRVLGREDFARIEQQRLAEERETERLEEEEEAERAEARRVEEERETARVESQQAAARTEELGEAERLEAQRVAAEGEDAGLEAEQNESERALVERAALAYRSESQRATAEASAARYETEQPLTEQFRLARERLDALEARRIDRVDVSDAALSRLAF